MAVSSSDAQGLYRRLFEVDADIREYKLVLEKLPLVLTEKERKERNEAIRVIRELQELRHFIVTTLNEYLQ